MGRERRAKAGPVSAKDRHKRAGKIGKPIDRSEPLPPGLVAAKPIKTITNSKHQSYFEFIENKDKKKPLLFEVCCEPSSSTDHLPTDTSPQITPNRTPPPGMKYIPIGNPELTERCKEISRELGASVYIVVRLSICGFERAHTDLLARRHTRRGTHRNLANKYTESATTSASTSWSKQWMSLGRTPFTNP